MQAQDMFAKGFARASLLHAPSTPFQGHSRLETRFRFRKRAVGPAPMERMMSVEGIDRELRREMPRWLITVVLPPVTKLTKVLDSWQQY